MSQQTSRKSDRVSQIARYENVVAFRTGANEVIGFHAHNLQTARLDSSVWQALTQAEVDAEVENEIATWNREIDPRASDAHLSQEVRSLTINIAQVCNLKCTYCAAGGDGTYGDPMKDLDLTKIYEQLRIHLSTVREGEEFRLTFLGGEPLVAPQAIKAIARFAQLESAGRKIDLRFCINTNGTLVTPAVAELLASLQCHVTVSLDGPPEVNDRNRPTAGGLGSTSRTLKGLENLLRVRSRLGSLNAAAIFGKHHTGVLATYQFLHPFQFDSIKFDYAAGDHDQHASQLYFEELSAAAEMALRIGGEKELRRILIFDTYFQILDTQVRIQNHCGAGKSHLQVDTRGRVYTCQWFVNDATEQVGEGSHLDRTKLAQYAQPLIDLNDCRSCWAKHLCGGGCMVIHKMKTGSKHNKDTDFCRRTRNIIAKGIEYYAQTRYQDQ